MAIFWRECAVRACVHIQEQLDKYEMLLSIFRSFCVNQNKQSDADALTIISCWKIVLFLSKFNTISW